MFFVNDIFFVWRNFVFFYCKFRVNRGFGLFEDVWIVYMCRIDRIDVCDCKYFYFYLGNGCY